MVNPTAFRYASNAASIAKCCALVNPEPTKKDEILPDAGPVAVPPLFHAQTYIVAVGSATDVSVEFNESAP